MKIAFFTYLMLEAGGGVAKYFIETATELKRLHSETDFEIITFDKATLDKILRIYSIYFLGKQDRHNENKENINLLHAPGNVKYRQVKGIRQLKDTLRQYDVIYTTNNLLEVLLLKLIGFNNLPPVIIGFHIPSHYYQARSLQAKTHNFLYNSVFYYQAVSGAGKIHVLNSFDENRLKTRLPEKTIIKIYNPFNFQKFTRTHRSDKIPKVRQTRLLWVGRLTEQKGVHDLCELITRVNQQDSEHYIWNIAGKGELLNHIKNLTKQWNNVHYLGFISNTELPEVYSANDYFVSTSIGESFPYVLLEAQSAGLPVVCYNIPGSNDIIQNNKNGIITKNVEEMKKAILSIYQKPVLTRNEIIRYISNKFDSELLYKKLYALLTDKINIQI